MEIKLKENSNLIVKDHNGNNICSIDEATKNVIGCGTKLYKHSMGFAFPLAESVCQGDLTILSTRNTAYSDFNNLLWDMQDGKVIMSYPSSLYENMTSEASWLFYCMGSTNSIIVMGLTLSNSTVKNYTIPNTADILNDTVTEL